MAEIKMLLNTDSEDPEYIFCIDLAFSDGIEY